MEQNEPENCSNREAHRPSMIISDRYRPNRALPDENENSTGWEKYKDHAFYLR